jgi:hypothetical protein
MHLEHQLHVIDRKLNHLDALCHEIIQIQLLSCNTLDPQALKASQDRLRASAEALKAAVENVSPPVPPT